MEKLNHDPQILPAAPDEMTKNMIAELPLGKSGLCTKLSFASLIFGASVP